MSNPYKPSIPTSSICGNKCIVHKTTDASRISGLNVAVCLDDTRITCKRKIIPTLVNMIVDRDSKMKIMHLEIEKLKAEKLKLAQKMQKELSRKRDRQDKLEEELRETRTKVDRPVVNKTVHYHGNVDNSVKMLNIGKKSIDWLRNDKFLEIAYSTWKQHDNPILSITKQLEATDDCEQKKDLLMLKEKDPKQYDKTILNTIIEEVEKSNLPDKDKIIRDAKKAQSSMYEVD